MSTNEQYNLANRWGGYSELVEGFTGVSDVFLEYYTQLTPHEGADGLNSTEAMFIIQLMSYKWTENEPFPSLGKIAERMGLSRRQIRKVVSRLEELGYVKRTIRRTHGQTSTYNLDGLFDALMAIRRVEKGMLLQQEEAS